MSDIKPTPEHLSDPYVLQLIEALAKRDDALEAAERRIAELEAKIEDACLASSDTQPSWKHRCYQIMNALGWDYGDPDWEMPDDRKRIEELEAKIEIYKQWHYDNRTENERLRAALQIVVDSIYCNDGYRNVSISEKAEKAAREALAALKEDDDGQS